MPPKDANLALSYLSRAHSPSTSTQIHTQKVATRPLHLKPTIADNAQQLRRAERARKLSARKKKLKPKPLSSRQRRALCLYDIPKHAQKYAVYQGLHELWVGYMREVLGEGVMEGKAAVGEGEKAKLCSADYHGAELEVVRSSCVSRVGIRGIVVKDSKFVFEIVTKGDVVKTCPKEGTIFRVLVPRVLTKAEEEEGKEGITKEGEQEENMQAAGGEETEKLKDLTFELHGDQFIFRAADRANRKFKPKYLKNI